MAAMQGARAQQLQQQAACRQHHVYTATSDRHCIQCLRRHGGRCYVLRTQPCSDGTTARLQTNCPSLTPTVGLVLTGAFPPPCLCPLQPEQVEWYNKTSVALQRSAGKKVPASAWFHIPLPEYDTAYQCSVSLVTQSCRRHTPQRHAHKHSEALSGAASFAWHGVS